MILLRVPQLLVDEERLVCSDCRETVEWRGRWQHTFAEPVFSPHEPRGARSR